MSDDILNKLLATCEEVTDMLEATQGGTHAVNPMFIIAYARDVIAKTRAAIDHIDTDDSSSEQKEPIEYWIETLLITGGHMDEDGWIDTMCLSHVIEAGDALVKLGLYDIRPHGYGRRQFYRKIKKGE